MNLDRVEDIQREVKSALEKAEEESGRLKVYNGLKERLREIDIALLTDGYVKLSRRETRLKERMESLAGEMEKGRIAREAMREKIATKEEEIAASDKVTRQLELDIQGKEKDMESRLLEVNYLDGEKRRLDATGRDLRTEVDRLSQKIDAHKKEIEGLLTSNETEKARLKRMEEEGVSLAARREELRRMRERIEHEGEEERNRLFGVMTRLTEIRNSILDRQRIDKERLARKQRRLEEERLLKERLAGLQTKLSTVQERLGKEKEELTAIESEESALSARYDRMNGEIIGLRNDLEGLKGVKRGKEEVLKQMKSYGEGRKTVDLPYRRLINVLKPSKDNEQMTEKFFPKEMEYHVLTEGSPRDTAAAAEKYDADFVFFPPKGMFDLNDGEAEVRLLRAEAMEEVFERIERGEEGLFLTDHSLVDSRGFIRKGTDSYGPSIREFREKMRTESEIGEIEEEPKTKAMGLEQLQLSLKELDKSRQALRDRKKSRQDSLTTAEKEEVEVKAQIRTAGERLSAPDPFDQPGVDREDDGTFSARMAQAQEKCEVEKAGVEQGVIDLKARLEETKDEYGRIDGEFHETSIAIERLANQLKKNEEEAARKGSSVGGLRKEKTAQGGIGGRGGGGF